MDKPTTPFKSMTHVRTTSSKPRPRHLGTPRLVKVRRSGRYGKCGAGLRHRHRRNSTTSGSPPYKHPESRKGRRPPHTRSTPSLLCNVGRREQHLVRWRGDSELINVKSRGHRSARSWGSKDTGRCTSGRQRRPGKCTSDGGLHGRWQTTSHGHTAVRLD